MAPTRIPVPPDTDQDVGAYFARLEALRHGHDEGWFRVLAGDPRPGRYLVENDRDQRLLHQDDTWWWILGVADGFGCGQDLLQPPQVPTLLTIEQAAERLGMSDAGVRRRTDLGKLYCVYPSGERRLIAAEIRAEQNPGVEDIKEQWRAWRRRWPDGTRLYSLADVELPVAPPLLTLRGGVSASQRRLTSLRAASGPELIQYLWFNPDTDSYGVNVNFQDAKIPRELPADGVLPWLQGLADQRGRYIDA